jgi:methylthioribose-1-phosphate isomerase
VAAPWSTFDLECSTGAQIPIEQRSEREVTHVRVSDDPRVGTEVAGYRIESLLGLGGMSVVYLAEDLRLKRKVALKLLASASPGRIVP